MVTIHPEGKITDKRFLWRGVTDLSAYIDESSILPENKELIKRFVQDARLGKTIKEGAKKRVGILRQVKYFQDLRKLDAYFKKPLDQVGQDDLEHFIKDLEDGKVVSNRGKPFQPETQVCMKKIIIKFYKWLNNGVKPDKVSWIDTSFDIKDYKAINETQVNTILTRINSNTAENQSRNRAIVIFLFDSGVRADELLNVRLHHLTIDKENYKVRIEFSKTLKRTIMLPLCKKLLDEWLAMHPAKNEPLAQLFPLPYQALCNVVKRAGDTIGVKLTPHGLRHSSATHYAKYLSRFQICYREGWAMSSKQPDRYIDREGLDQERVVEMAQADSLQKLSHENGQLNQRLAMMEEQMGRLLQKDKEELLRIIDICSKK